MNNKNFKEYCSYIIASITVLTITSISIVEAKYGFGMENFSYKKFIIYSILNNFSSYWLLVIVTFILSISVIFFSARKIYLLKKNK